MLMHLMGLILMPTNDYKTIYITQQVNFMKTKYLFNLNICQPLGDIPKPLRISLVSYSYDPSYLEALPIY